jgi:hypothetical protein
MATDSASPEQFADHRSDRAQLTTWNNALAETINGLYKIELIKPGKPWRTIEDIELATAKWVHWFQPPPPLRILRRHPTSRTGGRLLRSTPKTSRRLSPQIRKSPDSPGRLTSDQGSLADLAPPPRLAPVTFTDEHPPQRDNPVAPHSAPRPPRPRPPRSTTPTTTRCAASADYSTTWPPSPATRSASPPAPRYPCSPNPPPISAAPSP